MVFSDGTLYGPQSVDVDRTSYELPIWRFRTRQGTNKTLKGLIPVRHAYDSIVSHLTPDPASAVEWDGIPFHPPGSHSDRALVISFDDDAVVGSFFRGIPTWFQELARGGRTSWEEAASPANIVPASLTSIAPKTFVEMFGKKEYSTSEPAIIFNSQRLPPLPKQALSDEYGARQHLLSCLNATLTAEAFARQKKLDDPSSSQEFAMLKVTLQPLWTSFGMWCQKKLHLRSLILNSCFQENTHVFRLLSSNPLTPDLFDPEALQTVFDKADNQAKGLLYVLGYRTSAPKRQQQQHKTPGTPKKQRAQQTSQQQQGQSQQYQRQYQTPPRTPSRNQEYYTPGRKSPQSF